MLLLTFFPTSVLESHSNNTFVGGSQWFERRQLHYGSCCSAKDKGREESEFPTGFVVILTWSQATAGSSVFPNSMDTLAKKSVLHWHFTFPQLYMKESLETVWRRWGLLQSRMILHWEKPTVYMQRHTNRESYNRKQTPSDLKDLLIPRQKVSAIFSYLTIRSHTLILISNIHLTNA